MSDPISAPATPPVTAPVTAPATAPARADISSVGKPEAAAGTATLTLHRTATADARQRQVYMSLDGETIATLLFGQRVTREIPAGQHRLRANNTLVWKTIEFDARPGADLHFTIVNRAAPGMLWLVGLFGAGPMTVSLEPASPADIAASSAAAP